MNLRSADMPGSVPARASRSADDRGMTTADTVLLGSSGLLLGLCFVTGGSSAQTGVGVMLAEWLALPILCCGVLLAWWRQRLRPARWAIAVAVAIFALPLLQLLPLPEWLWRLSPARLQLADDLAVFGGIQVDYRWSLTPLATERGLYLLLPAEALFFSALALGRSAWRGLLWWLLALALFSMLLGFVQLGVPQDSWLNPFPQYQPMLAGVFANPNHQAISMAIALVLSLSLLLDARTRIHRSNSARAVMVLCAVLAAAFVLVLPLLQSRAGVIIALVGCGVVLWQAGPLSPAHWHDSRATRVLGMLALVVLVVGSWAAFAWMEHNMALAGTRWEMTTTTFALGFENLPFGSGFGSYVRMFEQATQGALMHHGYINNAHNDYVQWWFEGGLLAVAVLLAALLVWLATIRRLWRLPGSSRLRASGMAAWTGTLLLLLHSTVDYPLRTPALMTVFGLLAGIAVAASARESSCDRERAQRAG